MSSGTDASEDSLLRFARWMLILTAAAMPAFVIRWHVGPLPTTLLENLILGTVGLFVVGHWASGRRLLRSPYDLPIVLLLVAGALAVLVPPDHRAALGIYRAYLIEPIAAYYVAVGLLRSSRHFRWMALALALAGTVFAVLRLATVAVLAGGGPDITAMAPTGYLNANAIAMFMEPLAAVGLGFVLFGATRRERLMAGIWLAVLLAALVLTFSRGAYLALIALALVAILSARQKLVLLVATVTVGLLVLWRVPKVSQRISIVFSVHDSTNALTARRLIWQPALSMLRDHPLLGAGLSGYKAAVLRYALPGTDTVTMYPHNLWLTFWSELGLLGLLAFSWIYFALLWRGWRALAVAGCQRAVLWGATVGILLMGVHGLIDQPYWRNDLSLEFWLLAAVQTAAIVALRGERSVSPPAAQRLAIDRQRL